MEPTSAEARSAAEAGRRSRPRRPPRRVLTLLVPLGVSAAIWFVLLVATSWPVARDFLWAGAAALFAGTSVIFGPAVLPEIRLSTWQLAALVVYMNSLAGFLYAFNLDLLERLPVVGPYLRRARQRAVVSVREHPWIRRLATVGVGLFVLLPLPGSGSLGGCLIGRIIGLSALRSFLTVTVAGAVVALAYVLAGNALKAWLDSLHVQTPVRIAGAAIVLVIAWLLVRLLRHLGAPDEEPTD